MSAWLELRGFGLRFGEQVVLADVTLATAADVLTIVGPGGAGKSALLRTLSGANQTQPALAVWGAARLHGAELEGENRPALVAQNSRLLTATVFENLASGLPDRARRSRTEQRERIAEVLAEFGLSELLAAADLDVVMRAPVEQRLIALARALLGGSVALAVDEPTAGLSEADAARIVETLRRVAARRRLLHVTHHQGHARALGGETALLAGGRVIEHRPTADFFERPLSAAALGFVREGSCAVPMPGTPKEELADGVTLPPPPPAAPRARASNPTFRWLLDGRLGGLARPGLLRPLDEDLDELAALGVTTLVTLEEEPTVDWGELERRGIRSRHFPIPDMAAPELSATLALLAELRGRLHRDEIVAVHCRAGLGRTGTILAAFLVYEGATPLDALESARTVNPRWVQSEVQVKFLDRLPSAWSGRTSAGANDDSVASRERS